MKALAVLKIKVVLAVKTCLFTRPVSFITKPEVYQLANNARITLYGKHKRSKKKLIAWEIEVVSTTSTTSISFKTKTKKIGA